MPQKKLSPDLQAWACARRRFHLSHAHVQMARELGMNPRKLGKLDNHDQEPWKAPLPAFIERIYLKSFGKERPDVVISIEQRARLQDAKRAARKEARRRARAENGGRPPGAKGPFEADQDRESSERGCSAPALEFGTNRTSREEFESKTRSAGPRGED